MRTKFITSLSVTEKYHGLTYTVFSWVGKASDIGIIKVFPRVWILDKVKNQGNMKYIIQEEKRLDRIVEETTKYMHNLGPLELPDVRVGVLVDVGVNVGVDAGEGIGVVVAADNSLGSGDNSVINIIQPLMNEKRSRIKEALYGVGNNSEILS